MSSHTDTKTEVYTRFPLSSVLIYNSVTLLHFLLGGLGIILGYNSSPASYIFGFLYLAFAFGQMYLIMPLTVCPNCVYYRTEGALCTSGLNLLSKRMTTESKPQNFAHRAQGPLCHNNLYNGRAISTHHRVDPGPHLELFSTATDFIARRRGSAVVSLFCDLWQPRLSTLQRQVRLPQRRAHGCQG
jgi:hypothetical protein